MQRNRKDHIIPQGYLRGFRNPAFHGLSKPLWYLDIQRKKWSRESPGSIAYERGFYDYSVSVEQQLGITSPDQVFDELEQEYPIKLQELRKRKFADWEQHLAYLLRFAQMLRCRSLLFLSQQQEQAKTDILGVVEWVSDDGRQVRVRQPTAEEISEEKRRDHALSKMKAEIEKGVSWMGELTWAIRVARNVFDPFILCESPVSLVGTSTDPDTAFEDPDTFVQVPLGWDACLLGRRAPIHTHQRFAFSPASDMQQYRQLILRNAKSFIVSPTNLI